MFTTTLTEIRKSCCGPLTWRTFLEGLGKRKADDEELSVFTIIDKVGLRWGLWVVQHVIKDPFLVFHILEGMIQNAKSIENKNEPYDYAMKSAAECVDLVSMSSCLRFAQIGDFGDLNRVKYTRTIKELISQYEKGTD